MFWQYFDMNLFSIHHLKYFSDKKRKENWRWNLKMFEKSISKYLSNLRIEYSSRAVSVFYVKSNQPEDSVWYWLHINKFLWSDIDSVSKEPYQWKLHSQKFREINDCCYTMWKSRRKHDHRFNGKINIFSVNSNQHF